MDVAGTAPLTVHDMVATPLASKSTGQVPALLGTSLSARAYTTNCPFVTKAAVVSGLTLPLS